MEKSVFKKVGLLAGALTLAASLSACSHNEETVVDETEVQQSEEVVEVPQSTEAPQSASSGTFPLQGSFLANSADPENIELDNACLQLENNLNALQPLLDDIDIEMESVDPTSPERAELNKEYIDLFNKATTQISNEEVTTLWEEHVANLTEALTGIQTDNMEQFDSGLERFEITGGQINDLCFSDNLVG